MTGDPTLVDGLVLALAIFLLGALAGVLFYLNQNQGHGGPGDGDEGLPGGFPEGELFVPSEWSGAPQTLPEPPPRSDHGRFA